MNACNDIFTIYAGHIGRSEPGLVNFVNNFSCTNQGNPERSKYPSTRFVIGRRDATCPRPAHINHQVESVAIRADVPIVTASRVVATMQFSGRKTKNDHDHHNNQNSSRLTLPAAHSFAGSVCDHRDATRSDGGSLSMFRARAVLPREGI
jgi:hypothetical protein